MYSLTPYLSFRAQAAEAMAFYHSVFGGELTSNTFGDLGLSDDPAEAGLVMHAQLVSPQVTLMAADVPASREFHGNKGMSLSLFGGPEAEAELCRIWDRLAWGGVVVRPLEPAPWGDRFGIVADRFGISWLVDIGNATAD